MNLSKEDNEAIDKARIEFKDSFMKPKFYLGEDIQEIIMNEGLDMEDDSFYCRLSADGFMDQTDLSGPYATVQEAAESLIEMYGSE